MNSLLLNQYGENAVNNNRNCTITYTGKNVILTESQETHLETLIREMFHGMIEGLVKIANKIKESKFGKGLFNMKGYRKNLDSRRDSKIQVYYDKLSPTNFMDSVLLQKGFR